MSLEAMNSSDFSLGVRVRLDLAVGTGDEQAASCDVVIVLAPSAPVAGAAQQARVEVVLEYTKHLVQ
jgi:hypothetical protein